MMWRRRGGRPDPESVGWDGNEDSLAGVCSLSDLLDDQRRQLLPRVGAVRLAPFEGVDLGQTDAALLPLGGERGEGVAVRAPDLAAEGILSQGEEARDKRGYSAYPGSLLKERVWRDPTPDTVIEPHRVEA